MTQAVWQILGDVPEDAVELSAEQAGFSPNDRPTMIRQMFDTGVVVVSVDGPLRDYESYCYPSMPILQMDLDYLEQAAAVTAVVFNFNCTGGATMGAGELCQRLMNFGKPTVAFASGWCASLAYRLSCCCGQIVAGLDAEVGSIGTKFSVDDYSQSDQMSGIQRYHFATGPYKAIGTAPVTAEHQLHLQEWVNRLQAGFDECLRYRGMTDQQIAAVSDGRWWGAADALRLGLVDAVSTLNAVVSALSSSPAARLVSTVKVPQMAVKKTTVPAITGRQGVRSFAAVQSGGVPAPAAAAPQQAAPQQSAPAAAAPQQSAPETPAPAAAPQQSAPASPMQIAAPETPAPAAAPQQSAPASPMQISAPAPPAAPQAPAVLTYQQVLEACKPATPTAEFVVSQLAIAGNTPEQVTRNFIGAVQQQAAASFGVSGLSEGSPGAVGGTVNQEANAESDPMTFAEQAIEAEMRTNRVSRRDAFVAVMAANEGLLERYRAANQALKNTKKASVQETVIARRKRNCAGYLPASDFKAATE